MTDSGLEAVISPYTNFGIDTSIEEIWLHFLFGVSVLSLIGCYGQTEVNLRNPNDNFCEAWSEDSMCQVPWKSDNLGDL